MSEKTDAEKENIHQGHRERLKQRCVREGLNSFTDHQALELLLFYAMPYKDTNELAHRLLQHFGAFSDVLDADYIELLRVPGVGKNTATLLSSFPEFFRRYKLDKFGEKPILSSVALAGEYCANLFLTSTYEAFYLICLDSHLRVQRAALINEGALSLVSVPPRLVVEAALRHRAACVLFSHNHPSGVLRPSAQDLELTQYLASALDTIDIKLLDHIIVARGQYFSMAQKGLVNAKYYTE